MKTALELEKLKALFLDAVSEGYKTVAFSGGEPLLHPNFAEIVQSARDVGLATLLTTNGTLLHRPIWEKVRKNISLVAVSVDGPPSLHNEMRGSSSAFERMERGLTVLNLSTTTFGIIHTVTRKTVAHLDWLAEFAAQNGACLLQLHPLGLVGNGSTLSDLHPDGETMAKTWIAALTLQKSFRNKLNIQVDLFNRDVVRQKPELIYASSDLRSSAQNLAALVNPLVIMASGDVSPVCHNMPEPLRLGNLHKQNLKTLANQWRSYGNSKFRAHCCRTWELLEPLLDWPYFNWYEVLELSKYSLNHN